MDRLTKLQKSVLVATADIPHGETRSYNAIAEAIDRPGLPLCRYDSGKLPLSRPDTLPQGD